MSKRGEIIIGRFYVGIPSSNVKILVFTILIPEVRELVQNRSNGHGCSYGLRDAVTGMMRLLYRQMLAQIMKYLLEMPKIPFFTPLRCR